MFFRVKEIVEGMMWQFWLGNRKDTSIELNSINNIHRMSSHILDKHCIRDAAGELVDLYFGFLILLQHHVDTSLVRELETSLLVKPFPSRRSRIDS